MKILVIEDERGSSDLYKNSLESENFIIESCNDLDSGFEQAIGNVHDLIILDCSSAVPLGPVFCRDMRQRGAEQPLIVVTSITKASAMVDIIRAGADDCLIRPFLFKEFLARIRLILQRMGSKDYRKFRILDLKVDIRRHTVVRGNRPIYLTRKEFSLLVYFLENREIVLSRRMIMENVWDSEANLFSNTIESHILKLRKKIDASSGRKLIRTIPGRGYKISELG